MGVSITDIQAIPAFSRLSLEGLDLIRRAVVERTFPPGQIIFLEGERSQGLWFLKEGRVKIFRMSADGREQGLCLMRSGMCCGCPLFYGDTNPASAQALDTVILYLIGRDAALDLADRHTETMQALSGVFAKGERLLSTLVVSLSCSRLVARLAQILLDQAEGQDAAPRGGSHPSLKLSHQELADLAGTSREVVSRCLQRLQQAGAIELGRKRITILNSEKLEAMIR